MTLSWGLLLSVAQVVWVVLIATFILLERRSPTATLAWITMVAALPLVGVAIYLLVGPRHLRRKKLRLRPGPRPDRPAAAGMEAGARQAPVAGRTAHARGRPARPPAPGGSARGRGSSWTATTATTRWWRPSPARVTTSISSTTSSATTTSGLRIIDALVERARAGIEVRLLVDAVAEGLRHATVRSDARRGRRRPLLQPRASVSPLVADAELSYPPQDRGHRRVDRVHRRNERHRRSQRSRQGQGGLAGHPRSHGGSGGSRPAGDVHGELGVRHRRRSGMRPPASGSPASSRRRRPARSWRTS